ncbi:MAG: hypothetical protein AABW63_02365 [Nanoarchaeota archaeon]
MISLKTYINKEDFEKGSKVLNHHFVEPLTKEGALEAGIWCIGSQATPWEMARDFIYRLRKFSYPDDPNSHEKISRIEVTTDVSLVNRCSKEVGWRFAYSDRFREFIEYFGKLNYDKDWHYEVRDSDGDFREEIVQEVKWMGRKTFSFWHICLGGKKLLALDVWIMKALKDLGVDVPDHFVTSIARNVGSQKVRKTPGKTDYLRIEEEARRLFSKDGRFVRDGQVDMALVDGVLWWKGASRETRDQTSLFDYEADIRMPYKK